MSTGERDCGADAAAYVLGALDPAQAEEFRRHMSTCTVCQDEVAAFSQVADALHLLAPQLRAPSGLRRRVMRAVRADRGPAAKTRYSQRFPARLAPGPRRWITAGTALLVLAAVVLFGAGKVFSGGPEARVIQASVVGSSGRAEVRLADGRAELIVANLPQLPKGQVYEIWLRRPGRPPSPTRVLFRVTSTGAADVGVPGDVRGMGQVLVTPEPDGGSLAPTHAPVIAAQVS